MKEMKKRRQLLTLSNLVIVEMEIMSQVFLIFCFVTNQM